MKMTEIWKHPHLRPPFQWNEDHFFPSDYNKHPLLSLEGKPRNGIILLQYFKEELLTRLKIYEKCTKFSMKDIANIDALIESM